MIKDFAKTSKYKSIIVTFGKDGSYYIDDRQTFYCPAFETKPDGDKIGSGDTYMVFSGLAKVNKLNPELILSFGTFGAMQNLMHRNKDTEVRLNSVFLQMCVKIKNKLHEHQLTDRAGL